MFSEEVKRLSTVTSFCMERLNYFKKISTTKNYPPQVKKTWFKSMPEIKKIRLANRDKWYAIGLQLRAAVISTIFLYIGNLTLQQLKTLFSFDFPTLNLITLLKSRF